MEFIVIKFYERLLMMDESSRQWAKVTVRTATIEGRKRRIAKMKVITRKEALALIKENGLVESLECEHGKVWDTPNGSFQRKYKGVYVPSDI